MSRLGRMFGVRADYTENPKKYSVRPPKAGLGMAIANPTAGGKVKAATTSSTYLAPNMAMQVDWDAENAVRIGYLSHTYVMRCVRLRADTVAGLPFVAGPDPEDPATTTPGAPLARLLGPASPQNPGGPNPTTSARAFWAWSIVQRIATGRMAWELQQAGGPITGLWPLVSAALNPIPSAPGTDRWFTGFEYTTPFGVIPLRSEQVFYDWRPSALDWRQPESILQGAKLPIQIAVACDKYMHALLDNGMVASKIVISPPFEEEADRRAWEEQFFAEFSGFDNAGKTIFAEAENDYDENGKMTGQASVQVVDLSMKSVDAQLLEMVNAAKSDINIALGVPKSLIGDASQRIYANSDAEYRNFWTLTAINDVTELQDAVNVGLAPLLGPEVGWFDLSRVTALQPPQIIQPPALKDAIDEGVITPQQAAILLNIPAATASGEDTSTAPIGEELAEGASTMMRSMHLGRRAPGVDVAGMSDGWFDAPDGWGWRHRPVTSYTLLSGTAGWGLVRRPVERIWVRPRRKPVDLPEVAHKVLAAVEGVRSRRAEVSASARVAELEAEVARLRAETEGLREAAADFAAPVEVDDLPAEQLAGLERLSDALALAE